MDDTAVLIILAVFVAIAAVALVIQAGLLYGVYKSSRAMQEKVERLMPKIDSIADTSLTTLNESRAKINEITQKTSEILDITKKQMTRIEGVIEDAATRARAQLDRAEMVVDDAMTRAQQTVAAVHGGIIRPIREIHGITSGIKAALQHFFRGGRPSPDEVTADEEMFI
ncbi:MAG TPA: hypothetical protein VFW83_04855 [Bryobacteraceae bacterium]|nr:hypothetical protein [Bryobacteraceae bacterium]